MKTFLLFAALLVPAISFAQTPATNDSTLRKGLVRAGYQLQQSTKMHYQGVGFTLAGAGVLYLGTRATDESLRIPAIGAGAALGIAGFVLTVFVAPAYIKKAGLTLSSTGLRIPLHK